SGTVCASPPTPTTWTCSWNTAAVADGTYTLILEVTDNAGNREVTPIERTVTVDNLPPVVTFTGFTENASAQFQHVIGTTMYYNPAQSGSFDANVTAVDAGVGVN